jgi:DNA-binding response OmpR family regulator
MASDVVRILALGRGEHLDRAAAGLTGEGYAVAQVDDRKQARRLLKSGDFDVVMADGESKALSELASEAGGGRPLILLGRADGPVATPDNAVWMAPPVQTEALIDRVQELVSAARKPAQKTAGQKVPAHKASEARKASARVAGASRPAT